MHQFRYRTALCAVILAVALSAGCDKGQPAAGFYLTATSFGQPLDFVEIGPDAAGNTVVLDTRSDFSMWGAFSGPKQRIQGDGRRLVVRDGSPGLGLQRIWQRVIALAVDEDPPPSPIHIECRASITRPGDWDMIRININGKLESYEPPVDSALHRVDDPQVKRYFNVQDRDQNAEGALAIATGLLARHPDDPWIRTVYLDALLAAGQLDEAERRLGEWREDLFSREASGLARVPLIAERMIAGLRAEAEGRNAAALGGIVTFTSQTPLALPDYRRSMEALEQVLGMEVLVLHGRGFTDDPRGQVPNFLQLQMIAKAARVEATLRLLAGRRADALRLQAGSYWLGQLLLQDGFLIQRLIGTALRAIGVAGLETYALNACETDAEFRELWAHLERFAAAAKPLTEEELLAYEIWMPGQVSMRLNTLEAFTRVLASQARLELLRTATAARHCLVVEGDFPTSGAARFSPLLANVPADPYTGPGVSYLGRTSETLPLRHVVRATDGAFVCWSVGPDRLDDGAALEYDPTNGTTSAGDLFTVVPREREFPFPRDGVRVATAEELMALFPKGLPVDPFANNKNRGLNISEAEPAAVFSFGPDTDEGQPFRDARIWAWDPVAARWLPEPEWFAAAEDRLGPGVFRPGMPGMFPGMAPGMFSGMAPPAIARAAVAPTTTPLSTAPPHPEVHYDPSNGTVSEGDLFWEAAPAR